MPLPAYPLINGVRYDFSSVGFVIANVAFQGVKSIDYDDSLTPGEVRGNRATLVGRTRGKYEANASMELYKAEADFLIATLGGAPPGLGYMEVAFDITVTYSEVLQPSLLIVDLLQGCRIKKSADSGKEGEEASATKFDLHAMLILRNGRSPVSVQPGKSIL